MQAEVHVKIDTGMGRYGFLPDELDQLLPIFRYMPGLHVTGIYTHLHSAFCSQKATIAQAEAFQRVLDQLHASGCETGMAHMLNSAGLLKYPQYAMDGVRVGSAILGRVSVRGNFGLTRIGECQATVEELRWLPKGHSCGYGAGWTAKKPTRVAVFSVGWYHGFGVEMGNDLFRFRDCLRGVLRIAGRGRRAGHAGRRAGRRQRRRASTLGSQRVQTARHARRRQRRRCTVDGGQ